MNQSTTSVHFDYPSQSTTKQKNTVLENILQEAGIVINGDSPWDLKIHDNRVFQIIPQQGPLGAGEAYMDGMWDVEQLDEFFYRIIKANIHRKLYLRNKISLFLNIARHRLFNLQSKTRAWHVGERHYDIGNDLFEIMLDSSMNYSCAYWKDAESLEQAQMHKMDLICRKLQLQPGEKLLEIGCGWGGLAEYAARHFGAEVTGVTISKEQHALAQQRCRNLPVNVLLLDYRDIEGKFDKIVSVGMFEHVGPKNYPTYFGVAQRLLKDNGLFLLHTIGEYSDALFTDPWVQKYIFPNGKVPSARSIVKAIKNHFIVEDWHNFGTDYDRTLTAWWGNFQNSWGSLQHKYSQRFYRMWKYYLLSCAGYFRAKQGQLWQIVLSKPESDITYRSVR
ncbi:MAG: cyclopropane fatty acyl phospholipid synthase [Gammaproteobacteria bacterium]|nr:cyclopropane fatty acyl phospholipid synthase [Gammaproteobacteria bacterium]